MKNAENPTPVHYTRDPLWWSGILLMGLGEIGNFSAYGFSPASLVAPLGTTTVVGLWPQHSHYNPEPTTAKKKS